MRHRCHHTSQRNRQRPALLVRVRGLDKLPVFANIPTYHIYAGPGKYVVCRNSWFTSYLADERCDSMRSIYMRSSDTQNEPYQHRVLLCDANHEPAIQDWHAVINGGAGAKPLAGARGVLALPSLYKAGRRPARKNMNGCQI